MTVLALSPHLDDAVFSAGAALAAEAARGRRVVVATLLTGNVEQPEGFALACQLDKGLGPNVDYMAIRRAEDLEACALLGAEAVHRPLLEAPHRGYDNAAALFGPPLTNDPLANALPAEIAELLEAHQPDEVWAPRALGGHVDHVLLHRAARDAAPPDRLLWWTDWPYADRPAPADPEVAALAEAEWEDRPVPHDLRLRKADACARYRSQLGFQFGGEIAMRARVEGQTVERFARTRRR